MAKLIAKEISAKELGNEQAEMFTALIDNLNQLGIKRDLIEEIAVQVAGAASCNADGCHGMENPAEIVSNPILRR